MFRTAMIALGTLTLVVGTAPALAAPCKDAKGKFIKCAAAKPVAAKPAMAKPAAKPVAATHCRLHGKFAKCGTPGAKPA